MDMKRLMILVFVLSFVFAVPAIGQEMQQTPRNFTVSVNQLAKTSKADLVKLREIEQVGGFRIERKEVIALSKMELDVQYPPFLELLSTGKIPNLEIKTGEPAPGFIYNSVHIVISGDIPKKIEVPMNFKIVPNAKIVPKFTRLRNIKVYGADGNIILDPVIILTDSGENAAKNKK